MKMRIRGFFSPLGLAAVFLALAMIPGLSLPATAETADAKPVAFQTVTVNTNDTSLDLGSCDVTDLDAFMDFLDQLPALRQVDMYESTLTAEQMDTLSARYPNITFGWTLHIGDHTLRTDATAFSTLHNKYSQGHTSEDFAVLKYCKNLLALDLGHNEITDISFLYDLPNLRILILGRNHITDTTPIGTLKDLEYLELFSAGVTDISSLRNCTKLIDLNITNNRITDLSPVLSLPKLERLWLCGSTNGKLSKNSFTEEEKQAIQAQVVTGCLVNFSAAGTGGGWRVHPRYNVICDVFHSGVYRAWE